MNTALSMDLCMFFNFYARNLSPNRLLSKPSTSRFIKTGRWQTKSDGRSLRHFIELLVYCFALSPTHFVGAPSRKGPHIVFIRNYFCLLPIVFTEPHI